MATTRVPACTEAVGGSAQPNASTVRSPTRASWCNWQIELHSVVVFVAIRGWLGFWTG